MSIHSQILSKSKFEIEQSSLVNPSLFYSTAHCPLDNSSRHSNAKPDLLRQSPMSNPQHETLFLPAGIHFVNGTIQEETFVPAPIYPKILINMVKEANIGVDGVSSD